MRLTEKQRLILRLIKVGSGVAAGAMVLKEDYPILTIGMMIVAAMANEVLTYKNK